MKKEIGILVIASLPGFLEEIDRALRRSGLGFRFRQVDTKEALCDELQYHRTDVILSNHGLPALDGLTALAVAQERRPDIPFVFVTISPDEAATDDTVGGNATDGVHRSSVSRLAPTLRRAVREANERAKLRGMELRVLTSRWMTW